GHSSRDAVEIAAQTSGHSILVSGAAVICSMAGLFVLGDSTFNSLAVGSIIVVAVAVLGSITVLPALLSTLGRWVDRPRVPLLHRVTRRLGTGAISGRVLETLPTSIPEVQTMRDLSAAFPSEGTTADLVVRGRAGQQPEVAAALAKLE